MSPRDALLNPFIFREPTVFDPDRWLRPTSEFTKVEMHKAYLPFNRGPRMCIGFKYAFSSIFNIPSLNLHLLG
jgi:cytochrome P450